MDCRLREPLKRISGRTSEAPLRLCGHGLPRVVDLYVLVVIRLVARCLPADVTSERTDPAVDLHVLGQIVAPMERLTALLDLADELLGRLVLPDVPLAVVLPDELAAAVVTCVGPHRLVRIHVRHVLRLPDERALAQMALEGFRGPVHVGPPVQLQVPLSGERLVADDAREGPLAGVRLHMRAQVRADVQLWERDREISYYSLSRWCLPCITG